MPRASSVGYLSRASRPQPQGHRDPPHTGWRGGGAWTEATWAWVMVPRPGPQQYGVTTLHMYSTSTALYLAAVRFDFTVHSVRLYGTRSLGKCSGALLRPHSKKPMMGSHRSLHAGCRLPCSRCRELASPPLSRRAGGACHSSASPVGRRPSTCAVWRSLGAAQSPTPHLEGERRCNRQRWEDTRAPPQCLVGILAARAEGIPEQAGGAPRTS